jgi:peptide-methionine (S)-S-oxide reductase
MNISLTETDSIVLGGGCFWCLDALYKKVDGVTAITSGYAGGPDPDSSYGQPEGGSLRRSPTYEAVCTGETGYAEVVKLDFDPSIVSLEVILRIFFEIHDPTTLNQQGYDTGTQYRSIILYKDPSQQMLAEKVRDEAQSAWKNPIVTEITPLKDFYPAEDYHQDYYAKNPNQPYCVAVISPKLEKFLKK